MKRDFLFNPKNPKKSFNVYINKNKTNTIPITYSTVEDVKRTIKKLERLFKRNLYTHKRIFQVAMIMKVRLEAILKYHNSKYPKATFVKERVKLSRDYFKFLKQRTLLKIHSERKRFIFRGV